LRGAAATKPARHASQLAGVAGAAISFAPTFKKLYNLNKLKTVENYNECSKEKNKEKKS